MSRSRRKTMDVEALERAALSTYKAGKPEAAQTICQEILSSYPDRASTLHMLGVITVQQGDAPGGIELLRKAITKSPLNPGYHFNLGTALLGASRFQDAIASFEQALALRPDMADAHVNLADALQRLRRLSEAEASLRQAIQLRPDWEIPHLDLGNVLHAQARFDEAMSQYRRALALKPNYPEALVSMANTLCQLGEFEEAESACRSALALNPDYAMAHSNLGNALQGQKRLEEAIANLKQALAIDSQYAEAYSSLGSVYKDQKRYAEAEDCYAKALALRPDFPEAHSNLGIVLQVQEKLDEALASFERAVELRPDYAEAYSHIGTNHSRRADDESALAYYERALSMRPEYPEARYNRSLVWLRGGDWDRGWPEYEWRWKTTALRGVYARATGESPDEAWTGEPLPSGTLLLFAEQGFGDTLQFSRFIPLAAERAGKVVVAVPWELERLFASSFPNAAVRLDDEPAAAHDTHAPLLNLPRIFQATPEHIPGQVPYLRVDPFLARSWRDRLEGDDIKVGLVWRAGHEPARSMDPKHLAELGRVSGVSFYSLQKRDWSEPRPSFDGLKVIDLNTRLEDFADTAAALLALDLLITVDTSVPHLAGALGCPAWIALPYASEWRWLRDREDSPWYPSVRLFRQRHPRDWDEVIKRIASELEQFVEEHQRLRSR